MKAKSEWTQRHLPGIVFIMILLLFTSNCAQTSLPGGGQNNNGGQNNGNNGGQNNGNNGDDWIPMVNIQVTENANVDAFNETLAELESRNIRATIIVDEYISTHACSSLQDADFYGHEIMIYGRPDEPGDEVIALEMLSYAEQEEVITDAKTAVQDCLGKTVSGFRSYRFSQNEDTYTIVDSLEIEYNLSFVAHTYRSLPGHANDVLPYKEAPYNFWAVPMHSIETDRGRTVFCDMPFSYLTPLEYENILKSEFDNMVAEERPLLVEMHPYFCGVNPQRFDAFKNFLDYALSQGAEFITIEELVDWSLQNP